MLPRCFLALFVFLAAHLSEAADGRVFLVSLDGLGYETLHHDPVARELTSVHQLAKAGTEARGMTPHFPSTTANGHAAIWTGMWGDRNGIMSNSMPAAPRGEHTILDRVNGYRSDALRAEPFWVTAARQGVRTVAQQVTQAYPFTRLNTAENAVVLNGYQTKLIAEHTVLKRADVTPERCGHGAPEGAECFTWKAGPVAMHGVLTRGETPAVAVTAVGRTVHARAAPLETEPPRSRELARHFSRGLHLPDVAGAGPATVYFRLFEVSANDFLLYQSPIHELGVSGGPELRARLIREAGGYIGNGPKYAKPYKLGTPLFQGGDGAAERRYLEAVELVARQFVAHAEWLIKNVEPRLFIGYIPLPDEIDHAWKALAQTSDAYQELRTWGYVIANKYPAAINALRRPEDRLVLVSDHGMTPVFKEVHVNAALRNAGLLATDDNGNIDPARTKVMDIRNCLLVNTTQWKGGIVPTRQRRAVIAQAARVLRDIRDPETNKSVISRVYTSDRDARRFGYGGPNGADACFDYAPGYAGADAFAPELITRKSPPAGAHGLDPTRRDMEGVFIASGSGIQADATVPKRRAIDVAPYVLKLLGLRQRLQ